MDGIFKGFRRSKKAKGLPIPTHASGWSTPDSLSSGQRIDDGVYIITNKYHYLFISLEDPNGTTPLKGDFRRGSRNVQWHVKHHRNDQYSIENVEHNRYADSGNLAVVKAHVEGSSEERLWRIRVLSTGEYTIATTDTGNLWMLPDAEPDTPVELSNVHNDRRCRWTFEKPDTDLEVLNSGLDPVSRSRSYSPRIIHYRDSSQHGDSPVRRFSGDGSHSPHIVHTSSRPSGSRRGEMDVVHQQGSPRSGRSRARSRSASPIIVPGPTAQTRSRFRSRSRSPVIMGVEPRGHRTRLQRASPTEESRGHGRSQRAIITGEPRRHRSRSPQQFVATGPSERPRISQPNISDEDGRRSLVFMDRTLGGRSRTPTRVITTGSRRSRSRSPRPLLGRQRSRTPPIIMASYRPRSYSPRRYDSTRRRSPSPVIMHAGRPRSRSPTQILMGPSIHRRSKSQSPIRIVTQGHRSRSRSAERTRLIRPPPRSRSRPRSPVLIGEEPRGHRSRSPQRAIITGDYGRHRSRSPQGTSERPDSSQPNIIVGDGRRVRGLMSKIFGDRNRTPARVITTGSRRSRSRSPRPLLGRQRTRTPPIVMTSYRPRTYSPRRYDSPRVRSPSPISVHADRPRSPSPTRIVMEPSSSRRSRSQSPTRIVMRDVTDSYSGGQRAPDSQPRGDPINSGIYTITNVHHKRFVHLGDANDNTPLVGHYRPGDRNAQWQVKHYGNEQYLIESVDHNRYANCGPRAGLKSFVEGNSRDQLWRIQATPTGEYTIATTDTRNLWMLPYDDPDTPIWLSDAYADPRCWWTFQKQEIEALANENPVTQPVLSEPKPLVALAQIPAIPGDTDLKVLESEPYLAKHFGIHVPNLSGQVWRLNNGTIFSGTFSAVYPGMYGDKKVAIKVLRMTKQTDDIYRKFRRELLIWSRLQHVNVLPLYGYFEDKEGGDGFPSLISKWAEHGSAAQYITRDLRWDQRASLFYDVAKGLNYLHGSSPLIVHADLKPQNVVVNINGVGQLCDFGLTRFTQDGLETGLTTTTAHTGTVRYLAYELVDYEDEPVPTAATDMYALGCLGLEFIYRIPPHASLRMNYGKIIRAIGSGVPPAKRPANPEEAVSILWDLVEACWINTPEERPTTTQISDYLEKNLEALSESLEGCSWAPEYPTR